MTVRARGFWVGCLAVALATGAPSVRAEDPPPPHVAHFRTGVRFYKDGNFLAALAEFEESYRLKPGPSALQNVAVAQKALFRYVAAKQSVERLLREHEKEMSPEDLADAKRTLAELSDLVTALTVRVKPKTARVLVDGRPLDGGEERTTEVDPGEHRITAEAPGFRPFDVTRSMAGRTKLEAIELVERTAKVTLRADDADAAIAIDTTLRGYGKWEGMLAAGERHVVTVYKPGHKPVEVELALGDGEEKTLDLKLGPKDGSSTTALPYDRKLRRGPYGLLTANYYTVTGDPDRFVSRGDQKDPRDGTYFGVRAGWMLTPNFGIEGVFEAGKHAIGPGCYPAPTTGCPEDVPSERRSTYDLAGTRVGVGGRYMTRGETLRWLVGSGVGLVRNELRLPATDRSMVERLPSGKATAWNAFAYLEGGGEASFGPVLVDAVIIVSGSGVSNLVMSGEHPYQEKRTVGLAGIGLHVGYAAW